MQYITHEPMSGSEPPLLLHVAANLRAARAARGWTQQQLADRADVSRRMLVGMEAGESNASLGTLDRLAHALGVSFAELIRDPAAKGPEVLTPMLVWRGETSASRARLLASMPAGRVSELWEWSLAAGERYEAEADGPGMRVVALVLQGALTVEAGGRRERVEAGGTTAFPSDRPYRFENEGEEAVRFVANVAG